MVVLRKSIEDLHRDLVVSCTLVESMVSDAVRAVSGASGFFEDLNLQGEILHQRESSLEKQCLELLTLHQPVAGDLRRIAAVLKVARELKNISRLAVDIAQFASYFSSSTCASLVGQLESMGYLAARSISDSIEAYIREDIRLMQTVFETRTTVAEQLIDVMQLLQEVVREQKQAVTEAVYLLECARSLAALTDHSSEVAAHVYYLKHGEILPRKRRAA